MSKKSKKSRTLRVEHIRWADAFSVGAGGWVSAEDLGERDFEVNSVGIVVCEDEENVYLAGGVARNNTRNPFLGVQAIPRAMIRKRWKLK